jgi:hypothetical protein
MCYAASYLRPYQDLRNYEHLYCLGRETWNESRLETDACTLQLLLWLTRRGQAYRQLRAGLVSGRMMTSIASQVTSLQPCERMRLMHWLDRAEEMGGLEDPDVYGITHLSCSLHDGIALHQRDHSRVHNR